VIAAVVCDFERAAIGTRSRLNDCIAGKRVIEHVVGRLSQVVGVREIVLLVPPEQLDRAQGLQSLGLNVPMRPLPLTPRPAGLDARVRSSRQWNLHAWRGGAGQTTCFDEEYHPAALAQAVRETAADHLLIVHSHSILLDVSIASALIAHHFQKNHEMRVTYTPCAPGLSGMVLQSGIVQEMGEKNVVPGQLLGYDPAAPTFDTLIRDACMQVDPALSKIPNRFCVDTERSWRMVVQLMEEEKGTRGQGDKVTRRQGEVKEADFTLSPCHLVTLSPAALALAAARSVAPGVTDLSRVYPFPRELEIELTPRRLTAPPGAAPASVDLRSTAELDMGRPRATAKSELDPQHWITWLAGQQFPDDLLLTFAGHGDPLLYPHLLEVLRAARKAKGGGPLAICVQTDLVTDDLRPLLAAIDENLFDVLSITAYGYTAATYAKVARVDLHGQFARNLSQLAPIISGRGGVPLVVPRILKVRETIPELEVFFDAWIRQAGWAVIDYPTDLAGAVPFAGVVDMAPPKRKACRRIWERLLILSNGVALPCDQDIDAKLPLGNIISHTFTDFWQDLHTLRIQHAAGQWQSVDPCKSCREWHRA